MYDIILHVYIIQRNELKEGMNRLEFNHILKVKLIFSKCIVQCIAILIILSTTIIILYKYPMRMRGVCTCSAKSTSQSRSGTTASSSRSRNVYLIRPREEQPSSKAPYFMTVGVEDLEVRQRIMYNYIHCICNI